MEISVPRKDPWLLQHPAARPLCKPASSQALPAQTPLLWDKDTYTGYSQGQSAADLQDMERQEEYPAAVLTQALDW